GAVRAPWQKMKSFAMEYELNPISTQSRLGEITKLRFSSGTIMMTICLFRTLLLHFRSMASRAILNEACWSTFVSIPLTAMPMRHGSKWVPHNRYESEIGRAHV